MASKPPKNNAPEGHHELAGSTRPRSSGAKLLGPLGSEEIVSATLVLRHKPGSPPLPDQEYWQSTPLGQRRYLSPEQYAEIYGASQADLDAVTSFVTAHGLIVLASHTGRRTVSISGTAAQMNAAFGIHLNRYESPRPKPKRSAQATAEEESYSTHIHHGYDGYVHIPAELADIVTAVIGLDNRAGAVGLSESHSPAGSRKAAYRGHLQFQFFCRRRFQHHRQRQQHWLERLSDVLSLLATCGHRSRCFHDCAGSWERRRL
jgi:hypothetical protein